MGLILLFLTCIITMRHINTVMKFIAYTNNSFLFSFLYDTWVIMLNN